MPLPEIGNHLRVRVTNDSKEYYRSRLLEVSESNYYIEIPLHYETNVPLRIENQRSVWIEFNAIDGSLCRFNAQRLNLANIPLVCWEIEKPNLKDVHREQRRNFVRVQVDIPAKIRVIDRNESTLDCFTRDLSGGGVALVVPKSYILRPGLIIEIKFTLPQLNFPVTAKGFVIRVSEPNDTGFCVTSVQFIDLPESMRKRIIQFTFNRQRMNT